MLRALWAAAAGMQAEEFYVDSIAHNLANVNTTAFKRNNIDFRDLVYAGFQRVGAGTLAGNPEPVVFVGAGVMAGTRGDMNQGNLEATGNPLDLAIEGEGFFRVLAPDGELFTRDGTFRLDAEGNVVTTAGYPLLGEGEQPLGFSGDLTAIEEIKVSDQGLVSIVRAGVKEEVGFIQLARFDNPAGLNPVGGNLYSPTDAAGELGERTPGSEGTGVLRQGFLERSNVDVLTEMTNLILAQRAYQLNARAIETADQMMALANNLRA